MRLERNSYECWQEAYKKLQECNDNVIEVLVDSTDIDSGSIINLRYFFPLALYILRTRKRKSDMSLSITLNIRLTQKQGEGDRKRLESFFSQIPEVPGIVIQVEGRKLNNTLWRTSRIFPLCWVMKENGVQDRSNYQVLNKCIYDESERINKADQEAGLYAGLANELLKHILEPKRYVGTQEDSLSDADKNALQQELDEYLHEHLGHMSILAQIIWLYILRELIELKELYGVSEEGGEHPHIHQSIMMKSRFDAISYAEGMYQLIENACVHSFGGQAWFGFRMHRAGRNVTMSKLAEEIRTRNMLYEDYRLCFIKYHKNGKMYADEKNIFNDDYRFFFEFFVLDDASNQVGMIENYNEKIDVKKDKELEKATCIEGLFHIGNRNKILEDYIEDVTTHYGMRLLRKIISINNGYLVGKTPDAKWSDDGEPERQVFTQLYFDGNYKQLKPEEESDPLKIEFRDSFVTEWTAVLPIDYKWTEGSADRDVVNGKNCFGEKIEPRRNQLYRFGWEKLSQGINQPTKEEKIKSLYANMQKSMSELDKKKLEDAVILLQPDSRDISNLELFSKALFAQIVKINFGREDPVALRIAIFFDHNDAIFEFIRLFSAFYFDGKQSEMKNVQIALCIKNKLYGGIDDVAVMLAGEKLSSTYGYARLFAYHHAGNTLQYLPLIEYLTMDQAHLSDDEIGQHKEAEQIALFPFELCLPAELENREKQKLDWQHNWFFQRMKYILNTSIQDTNYGCLIDDIHIRLGSKLHLNRFYEAELLFHNMGNVARFAYIIAQELLYGNQKLSADQRVLLLGYEKYSSLLLRQVEYWIKNPINLER